MNATVMNGAGDVRVKKVPDPRLMDSDDALVRIALVLPFLPPHHSVQQPCQRSNTSFLICTKSPACSR
jgi:hypothetical protein